MKPYLIPLIALFPLFLQAQQSKLAFRGAYNFTNIGKNGSIGVEYQFNNHFSAEAHLRFHQNRQYKLWDEPNYWNRVHAFENSQFFGVGMVINETLKWQGSTSCKPMISIGSQYTHAGIKAQISELYGTIYDSAQNKFNTYKYFTVKTFKPMHILEQTLQFRMRFKVAGVFSMDYSAGIASSFEWGIDPALRSGKHQTKWLWGPTASIGLVFDLSRKKAAP